MLHQLACPAGAAHPEVFQGASETGHHMALEMIYADNRICFHKKTHKLCCFDESLINLEVYGVFRMGVIGDDNLGSDCFFGKPVFSCDCQVVLGIRAPALIKSIRFRKEGLCAFMRDGIANDFNILRSYKTCISFFSEMHLDSDFKIR